MIKDHFRSNSMPFTLISTHHIVPNPPPFKSRRHAHFHHTNRFRDLEPGGHVLGAHAVPPFEHFGEVAALVPGVEILVLVRVAAHPRVGHDADVGLAL